MNTGVNIFGRLEEFYRKEVGILLLFFIIKYVTIEIIYSNNKYYFQIIDN